MRTQKIGIYNEEYIIYGGFEIWHFNQYGILVIYQKRLSKQLKKI